MKTINIRTDIWADEYILFESHAEYMDVESDVYLEKIMAYKIKNREIVDKFECQYKQGLKSFEGQYRQSLKSLAEFTNGLPLIPNSLTLLYIIEREKHLENDIILPNNLLYALDSIHRHALDKSKGKGELEKRYGISKKLDGYLFSVNNMLALADKYEHLKEIINGGAVIDGAVFNVLFNDCWGYFIQTKGCLSDVLIDGKSIAPDLKYKKILGYIRWNAPRKIRVRELQDVFSIDVECATKLSEYIKRTTFPEKMNPNKDPKYKRVQEYIKQNAPRKVEVRELQNAFSIGLGRATRLLEYITYHFPCLPDIVEST